MASLEEALQGSDELQGIPEDVLNSTVEEIAQRTKLIENGLFMFPFSSF